MKYPMLLLGRAVSLFPPVLGEILTKRREGLSLFLSRKYSSGDNTKNSKENDELPVFDYSPRKDGVKQSSVHYRVYGWGNGEHGGLGNQIQRKGHRSPPRILHRPSRMHFAETHKVIDIACGYGFSAFAIDSKEHQLFGTGINTDFQIGYHAVRHGHPLGLLLAPVPVGQFPPIHSRKKQNDSVIGLSAGRAHLAILMASGAVYTMGSNHYGQCGHSQDSKKNASLVVPHHIPKAPDGTRFVSVECGQDHSLFVTEKGEVWGCGWGADGQMGQGDFLSSWKLQHIGGELLGKRVVKVSSVADTILALGEDGEVYGWGNNEYGQLLPKVSQPQFTIPLSLNMRSKVGPVKDVAGGGSYCLIATESGEVFVWGYGILGLGPSTDHAKEPQQIPATLFGGGLFQESPKVTKVATGLSYSVAILANGDMYSWGSNTLGYLGLGHSKDQFFPMKEIKLQMREEIVWVRLSSLASKVDNTLYLAYFIGEGIIFSSRRVINLKLMQAIASALKFETLKKLNLEGYDVWSLLKMIKQKDSKALEVTSGQRIYDSQAQNAHNSFGVDYTRQTMRKAAMENCLGSKPPVLQSLTIKSHSGLRVKRWLPEMEGFPAKATLRFKHPDLPKYLIELAEKNIIVEPLPRYLKSFPLTGKNTICLKDASLRK